MIYSFILAIVLAVCTAQDMSMPKPCCGSRQFEADMVGSGGMIQNGVARSIDYVGKIYYDFDRKLQKTEARSYDDATKKEYNSVTYTDFNTMMAYTLIEGVGCYPTNVTYEIADPCIPANATFLGRNVVGSQNHNIDVVTWMVGEHHEQIRITVSENDCTPVAESFFTEKGQTEQTIIFGSVIRHISNATTLAMPADMLASCNSMSG